VSKINVIFRTPKRLPHFLDGQIRLYAAAAGAAGVSLLALTQSAEAQIIYTSVHAYIPSRTFLDDRPTFLDMNGDGIPDVRFSNFLVSFSHADTNYLEVAGLTGGVIALSGGSAAALPKGAVIGSSGQLVKGTCFMAGTYLFAYGSGYFHNHTGPWTDVENRFLGVSFSIDGETHFGWIRLNVNTQTTKDIRAVITGYAYQSGANTPIKAGQTSGDPESADRDAALLDSGWRVGPSLGMLAAGAVYRGSAIRQYNVCRSQPK
jgi:hypothetical protein